MITMQAVRDLDTKKRLMTVLDATGAPFDIGDFVRYARDRDDRWNTDRWGIVTGISTSTKHRVWVQVTPVYVFAEGESVWDLSDRHGWYAEPQSLVTLL